MWERVPIFQELHWKPDTPTSPRHRLLHTQKFRVFECVMVPWWEVLSLKRGAPLAGTDVPKPSGTLCRCVESGGKSQFSLVLLSLPWQFLEAVQLVVPPTSDVKLVHLMRESCCRKNPCQEFCGKVVLLFWIFFWLDEWRYERQTEGKKPIIYVGKDL